MYDLIIDSVLEITIYTTYVSLFIYLFLAVSYSCFHAFSYQQTQSKSLQQMYITQGPIKNDYRIEFAQQTISWLPKTVRRLERKNEDEDYDYSSSIVAKMKNVCLEEE